MVVIGMGTKTTSAFEQECINQGMNDFYKLPFTEKTILQILEIWTPKLFKQINYV